MADMKTFAKRMRTIGKHVDTVGVPALVRRVALAVDQALVTSTPVDTGRARANWQASISTGKTDVIEPYSAGENGSTAAANASGALAQARNALAGFRGGAIHITNNVKYIGRLNEGSSAQAPANFVEKAVQVGAIAISKGRVLPK